MRTAPREMRVAAAVTAVSVALGAVASARTSGDTLSGFGYDRALGVAASVFGTFVSVAIWGVLYYFAFAGKRVAQIILVVVAALGILGGLMTAAFGHAAGVTRALGLAQAALDGVVLWLLTRPAVVAYVAPPVVAGPPPYAP